METPKILRNEVSQFGDDSKRGICVSNKERREIVRKRRDLIAE